MPGNIHQELFRIGESWHFVESDTYAREILIFGHLKVENNVSDAKLLIFHLLFNNKLVLNRFNLYKVDPILGHFVAQDL